MVQGKVQVKVLVMEQETALAMGLVKELAKALLKVQETGLGTVIHL
jgi:hypothetical protein